MALVAPNRDQTNELYRLTDEVGRATEGDDTVAGARVLGEVERFLDANPTVRVDKTVPDDDEDTNELAVYVAISPLPASVPVFHKIVNRQPDIRTKRFMHGFTLDEYILGQLSFMPAGSPGRKVLQDKLNPGQGQVRKVERLFGKPSSSPLPRGVEGLIGEMLSGIPGSTAQQKALTKKGGRRRKTRRVRKTKRTTRKTK